MHQALLFQYEDDHDGVARAPSREERAVIDQTLREANQKMGKAVDFAKEEFAAIRTGRAHPAMFSKLTAD